MTNFNAIPYSQGVTARETCNLFWTSRRTLAEAPEKIRRWRFGM